MLKRLFALGTLLCWASLAPASYELDRAAQALDRGQAAKARFLYGRILDNDPCDRAAQAGLIRAQGDPSPYRSQCPPEPEAIPSPRAMVQPSPAAAPAVAAPVASAQPSPVDAVTEVPEADALQRVGDIGAQPRRHAPGGGAPSHPWRAWFELMGLGVLAAGLALALVAGSRRRRASAASAPGAQGEAEPAAAPVAPDDGTPREAAPPAAPLPAPVEPAPQPVGPRALPPERVAAAPAAWASPLAPGEAVIARLDGARAQAGFTAHQFYFQGPRGVREGWFRRQETLTLAVPLHQVTGLGWARRGGERLIVGTALAGDIALAASDFGALALRQFAQQLASALERPLG